MEENKENNPQEYVNLKMNWAQAEVNKSGEPNGNITINLDERNMLLFTLWRATNNPKIPEDKGQDIKEALSYLSEHLGELTIKPNKKRGAQIKFKYGPQEDEIRDRINSYLTSKAVSWAIAYIIQEKKKLREELKKELKTKEPKKGKFKRSGHLTDQILKYTYPGDNSPQLSLWDSLGDTTKKLMETTVGEVEAKEIVEGIKLSPSEQKIIDSLCRMLHEKSQTLEPKQDSYYSGNMDYQLIEYGGDKGTPAPKLAFTLYELTREYKGGEAISGKDVDNVKNLLLGLDTRKFLMSYVETYKKKDGGRIERKIEGFQKLINILKISQTEYNKEDVELSKKEETIVLLNPIFRRQIDTKFITYPNDINRRTIIAYGSHTVSESTYRLRDYLARELSSKHYEPEINLDRLYWLLNEKWMKEGRRKKVKEYTDKALETCKALGLLLSYEIKPGATGEPKVVFKLKKGWA